MQSKIIHAKNVRNVQKRIMRSRVIRSWILENDFMSQKDYGPSPALAETLDVAFRFLDTFISNFN